MSEFARFTLTLAVLGLIGLVGGVLTAVATIRLDRVLELAAPVPVQNVETVMGALIGGALTIAVFTLWMRTVVVGLASGEISPRVVSSYLDDRFQRAVTGWMVGGLSYLVAVALALPSDTEEGVVPLISTLLSGTIVVVALISVLVAMRHAVGSLAPPSVIRSLTDQAFVQLEDPGLPDDPLPAELPDRSELVPVPSEVMGWVGAIDFETIVERLPPGGVALIPVAVGEFVAPGETIVIGDARLGEDDLAALHDAITIGRTRDTHNDLAFAIQQLVDVVQYALRPTSDDTATAHEALVHLRAVLNQLIRRGKLSACRASDDRYVVCTAAWEPADHVLAAFERLRRSAAQDPLSARALLRTFEFLRATAGEVGDDRSAEVLHREHDRLHELVEENGLTLTLGQPMEPRPNR